MSDTEEVLEQLEAKAKAADADIEDLGLVVRDEYEETQAENESLKDENSSLEEENEDLREEIESVKELYAESLAEATGLDDEFFMDKEVSELRELHEEKVDGELVETPEVKSGDLTQEEKEAEEAAKEQEETLEEINERFRSEVTGFEFDSVEELEDTIETYEGRGGFWEKAAEPYREALDELTAD